jgi:hypothetical protein
MLLEESQILLEVAKEPILVSDTIVLIDGGYHAEYHGMLSRSRI